MKVLKPKTICLIGPAFSKQQDDTLKILLIQLVEIIRIFLKYGIKDLMEKKNTYIAKDAC